MEVGRQITLWFIACFCANIIYTEELTDTAKTKPPSEKSSNWSTLETGNLNGKITAHKNGTKVQLTLDVNAFWKNDKSIDNVTCAVPAVTVKGEKGDTGRDGLPGIPGGKGLKGDKGDQGIQGEQGIMGPKGERGPNGNQGAEGRMGPKGNDGSIGPTGKKGECVKQSENLDERNAEGYGDENHPAYSCSTFTERKIFVNRPYKFEVDCKNYKAHVKELPHNFDLTVNKDEIFWLSSKIELKEFYGLPIPKLSYLMSTNKGFTLILTHSDEVEILEILSWNGIKNNILEIISKTLNGGQQGCKATSKKNTEGKKDLEISCIPAFYLPMDFYIKAKKENIAFGFRQLYFD